MITIPAQRRIPSLVFALAVLAMPVMLYFPYFFVTLILKEAYGGTRAGYWGFVVSLVSQCIAYGIGVAALSVLRDRVPPATRFGAQMTAFVNVAFIAGGGGWSALCLLLLLLSMFTPWD
jgi:hypothetical protein